MTRTVRVGDIAEQIRGVSYDKVDASGSPQQGYVPVLRAGNITDAGLTFHDLVYVPRSRVSDAQLVRKGDVVIAASSGSLDVVGKAALAKQAFDGGFGAFCKVLRPSADVDAGYFAHFFRTIDYRRRVSSLAAGANINNLRNEHLDEMRIPLPPLAEQRRIADILDRADAMRAKRREATAESNGLAAATFVQMFGDVFLNDRRWPEGRVLGDIAEVASGVTKGRKLPGVAMRDVAYLAVSNVQDMRLNLSAPEANATFFARRVAAVDKLKATHRASLVEMDAFFASLQHRAFRREL